MKLAALFAAVLAVAVPARADSAAQAAVSSATAALPRIWHGLNAQPAVLHTVDGWTLKAVWSPAQAGQPTAILLHGTGQRKEDWILLARAMTRRGYGWLAVDMRGHGESRVSPTGEVLNWKQLRARRDVNDYEDMTRDAEAGVGWLTGQGVPEGTIGMIGAEVGGSIAIKYAAVHPKVPFVILLSPGLSWREVPIVNAIRAYRDRPILMIHSSADRRSAKETPLLYEFAKLTVGPTRADLIVVDQERGTRMLRADKGLIGQILDWIANPVTPVPAVSTTTVAGVTGSTTTAPGVAVDTAAAPAASAVVPSSAPAVVPADPAPLNGDAH